MTRFKIPGLPVIMAVLMLLAASASQATGLLPNLFGGQAKPSLSPMLEKIVPGVVNISTTSHVRIEQNPLFNDPFFRRFFGIPEGQNMPMEQERQSLGSGVIVDAAEGYVITNNHLIEHADQITVILHDGRSLEGKVAGTDPATDITLIRIKAHNLTAVPFGDSDSLKVGDFVVAIGSPFGLSQTVTSGIVSALGRSGLGIEGYENFIQTDASINPGNSGGALVDLDGKLVGINTAIVGPTGGNVGIGFAIPSNMARNVMQQIVQYGEVKRGQLGVSVQDITPDLAKAMHLERAGGAVITQVQKGSAGEKAGLRSGDVVTSLNGNPVANASSLRNSIGMLRVGTEVKLGVVRDGKEISVAAQLGKPHEARLQAGKVSERLRGAELGSMEADHPLAGRVEGIEVVGVERGSPAWLAGLRKGDIIVSVDRQPVPDMDALRAIVKGTQGTLLLNVRRDDSSLFIAID